MENENRLTINDIAKMADTSKTTVSFYLNGKTDKMSVETKNKIQQVIEQTDYRPSILARSLNQKNSRLIGVIIGDITNTFSNQIVKGIEEVARMKGYQMIMGNSTYDPQKEENYVKKMLSLGVDGFIIQPTAQFKKLTQRIKSSRKPLVFFDSKLYDNQSNWVKTDNYEATYQAIESCIKKGYEQFMMIGANPNLLSTRIERASGFIDAMAEHNFEYVSMEIEQHNMKTGDIEKFVGGHLDTKSRTLIFVPNCWALPSVFTALEKFRQYIPDVLGLVGFDNTEWTRFSSPKVTTIVQPAFEEGQQTCRILIDQIEKKEEESQHQILNCSIRWEESVM